MKKLGIVFTLIILGFQFANAQLIKVEQEVFGMDCAPCAYGLERGLKKLDGLEKIVVSLNDGKAYLNLASGNTVTLKKIQDEVKKNGFSARNAKVIMIGDLNKVGNEWVMKVNNETFKLEDTQSLNIKNLASGLVKMSVEVADEDDKQLSNNWAIKIIEILALER